MLDVDEVPSALRIAKERRYLSILDGRLGCAHNVQSADERRQILRCKAILTSHHRGRAARMPNLLPTLDIHEIVLESIGIVFEEVFRVPFHTQGGHPIVLYRVPSLGGHQRLGDKSNGSKGSQHLTT